jgi:hypothetical protein
VLRKALEMAKEGIDERPSTAADRQLRHFTYNLVQAFWCSVLTACTSQRPHHR